MTDHSPTNKHPGDQAGHTESTKDMPVVTDADMNTAARESARLMVGLARRSEDEYRTFGELVGTDVDDTRAMIPLWAELEGDPATLAAVLSITFDMRDNASLYAFIGATTEADVEDVVRAVHEKIFDGDLRGAAAAIVAATSRLVEADRDLATSEPAWQGLSSVLPVFTANITKLT